MTKRSGKEQGLVITRMLAQPKEEYENIQIELDGLQVDQLLRAVCTTVVL